MEYLIKTYTNENETILDFTMGSGSTGVAAGNTKRNFRGSEFDDKYYNVKAAWDSGFSGIFANHDQCGMPMNVYEKVKDLL